MLLNSWAGLRLEWLSPVLCTVDINESTPNVIFIVFSKDLMGKNFHENLKEKN